MKKYYYILLFTCISLVSFAQSNSEETSNIETEFVFQTQLSSWIHINPSNDYQMYLGARAIPQINYDIYLPNESLIDFEASANLVGDMGIAFVDSLGFSGNISPYRVWGRYSTDQFELRLGLQKIDFGTAQILRTLRWFDQVDPRDPLQLTTGVYAALARYYFLDNTNIWFWTLYGNNETKGMEIIKTNSSIPEVGARIQSPILGGELGLSYHFRVADSRGMPEYSNLFPAFEKINENRIGLDGKWDLEVGLWFEASYTNKSEDLGLYTNENLLTVGTDYTLGIGSGVTVLLEHMYASYGEKPFGSDITSNFSAFSMMYPISMFDNLQVMLYYSWENGDVYSFVNWYRQFDYTTLYLMAYWNPEVARVPTGTGEDNLYGGAGIQLMYVITF